MTYSSRLAAAIFSLTLLFFGNPGVSAAQTAPVGHSAGASAFRVAGTIVSKTDGQPLARARVIVRNAKGPQKPQSVITSEDGKFEFSGLPAGKYGLEGAKRGFVQAGYDQHDQFSTAIVTGAGIDTEHLVLRLSPDAIIAGKVLDEAGEPIRQASVNLYFVDHRQGVDEIHAMRTAQTDDLGAYEMTDLPPGTYYLSATAKPWYAIHPRSEPGDREQGKPEPETINRSFDVAYPITYYADVPDADSATPIPVRGGEHLQVDFHLNPVPAIRVAFRVAHDGNGQFSTPRLEQPVFDGFTPLQSSEVSMPSPGFWEISGIPAGRYDVRIQGNGFSSQMNGVDLTKDGEEIDTQKAEPSSNVRVSAQVSWESSTPPQFVVGLRSNNRSMAAAARINAKGEGDMNEVSAGRYEVVVFGGAKPYSISRMSAEGAEVSGHTITVAAGSSPTLSITLLAGSVEVDGIAKRAGKGFAGAMVVLVPKDPENNRDLFRRDQSDLDGTFSLHNVVPGSYTIIAIENGWDLDWSKPQVIAAYAKHVRTVEVGNRDRMTLPEEVEVQAK